MESSCILDPRTKSQMDKTQKNKKALLDIDYDTVKDEKDFAKYFKPSKSLTLTKSTLTKYSKEKNTLPKDLHYDADKLFRLFCKSQVMVSCKGWKLCIGTYWAKTLLIIDLEALEMFLNRGRYSFYKICYSL